jgi:hypothetical protein
MIPVEGFYRANSRRARGEAAPFYRFQDEYTWVFPRVDLRTLLLVPVGPARGNAPERKEFHMFSEQAVASFQPSTARRCKELASCVSKLFLMVFLVFFVVAPAKAQTSLTTVYNFTGVDRDGSHPIGDLIMDSHGVLYGVTHGSPGDKIYQLIPPAFAGGEWTKVNIYNGNAPGTEVHGNFTPLIFGKNGELFGLSMACDNGPPYHGSCVFQLTPPAIAGGDWLMNILAYEYNFEYGDGRIVRTGKLAIDSNGNLYGITHRREDQTYGTVFQLSPSPGGGWTQTTIYTFLRFPAPFIGFWEPQDGLVMDQNGTLYWLNDQEPRDLPIGASGHGGRSMGRYSTGRRFFRR